MKIVSENRFSGKTYFIQLVPVEADEEVADVDEDGEPEWDLAGLVGVALAPHLVQVRDHLYGRGKK